MCLFFFPFLTTLDLSVCLRPVCLLIPCLSVCVSVQTSELGVTEHIEGDPLKLALWAGRTPSSDNKIVLKVCNHIII